MWTPAQVLPFLEHPDRLVRHHATAYFTHIADPGPATVSHALRAHDRYPDESGSWALSLTDDLPTTPECVAELLRRLGEENDADTQWALLRPLWNLSYPVLNATAKVLLASPVLRAMAEKQAATSEDSPDLRAHLELQLVLQKKNPEELWADLETLRIRKDTETDETPKSQWVPESLTRAHIMALALHPEFVAPKVMAILQDKTIEDWREIHAVQLAGALKLQAAIPWLVERYLIDADVLLEEVNRALSAIGTPEVVQRLREFIPRKSWEVRLFADDPLEHIKSVEAEDALLQLFLEEKAPEKDAPDLRTDLAYALTLQISDKGFSQVEPMVSDASFDQRVAALDEALYATAIMLNRPLRDAEKIRRKAEKAEARRREMLKNPKMSDFLEAMKRLAAGGPVIDDEDQPLSPDDPLFKLPERNEPVVIGHKTGRNEPCPCGSGKKYKKCCGK